MKLILRFRPIILSAMLVGFSGAVVANDSTETIHQDGLTTTSAADPYSESLASIAADRYGTIAGIVATWEATWGEHEGWKAEFTAALQAAADAQLLEIQGATSYDAIRAILQGKAAPASLDGIAGIEALGSLTSDLVFTPVVPCRIFDTRFGAGGTPPAGNPGTVRSYWVYGNAALLSQQGHTAGTGCAAPKGEPVAISANFTVVPHGKGHIRVWPYAAPQPNTSFLNYNTPVNSNLANAGIFQTCYLCSKDIHVSTWYGSADSLADVMGYFYPADEVVEHSDLGTCPSITVSPNWTNCGSITINAPGPGKVIVTTKAYAVTFGQGTTVFFGIGTNNSSIVDGVRVGVLDGTDTVRREFALMDQVVLTRSSAGSVTYYVNAQRPSVFSARLVNIGDVRVTAEYVAD